LFERLLLVMGLRWTRNVKRLRVHQPVVLVPVLLLSACGSTDPKPTSSADEAAVVRQYAVNLDANYRAVIDQVNRLQSAVGDFVANPSQSGLEAAQQAWLGARPAYGECEISRFYGGPMDAAQGGMNEWPIDETFVDYTTGSPLGGIINDTVNYPEITEALLRSTEERGGIENLSTGFHAIEFLLWGQRPDQSSGPGERPYTDYLDGGTAANQDRRRNYLTTAVDMLLLDMQALDADWDLTNGDSYGSLMVAGSAHDGLTNIVRGFTNLGISELFYERLMDPYVTQDRKDEESCFSESTIIDLMANAKGVENVYLGRYAEQQGPSVSDLVKAKSPVLDAEIKAQISAARAAIDAIPTPFDHSVIAPASSDDNMKVRAAIDAFQPMQDTLKQMADVLGVPINL
jgi:putative iron-regulated protein